MRTSTFRAMALAKVITAMERDLGTVDNPEYGLRKVDYFCKRANKLGNVWRQGRRNYMNSK